jgi:hypothetical protein
MNWRRLWFTRWQDAVFFFLVIILCLAYWHDTSSYRAVYVDPCAYCPRCAFAPLPLNVSVGSWVSNLTGGGLDVSVGSG